MPKKSTGYTPAGKSKSNPVAKVAPMKNISMTTQKLDGPNKIASVPNNYRFPKLSRPVPMSPKVPKI